MPKRQEPNYVATDGRGSEVVAEPRASASGTGPGTIANFRKLVLGDLAHGRKAPVHVDDGQDVADHRFADARTRIAPEAPDIAS